MDFEIIFARLMILNFKSQNMNSKPFLQIFNLNSDSSELKKYYQLGKVMIKYWSSDFPTNMEILKDRIKKRADLIKCGRY